MWMARAAGGAGGWRHSAVLQQAQLNHSCSPAFVCLQAYAWGDSSNTSVQKADATGRQKGGEALLRCGKDAGCHGYQIAISLSGSWFVIRLITHVFNTVSPQQKPYINPRFLHRAVKQIHVKKVSFESESCACNGADFESCWPCCASWRLKCSSLANASPLGDMDRSQKDINRSEALFCGSGPCGRTCSAG